MSRFIPDAGAIAVGRERLADGVRYESLLDVNLSALETPGSGDETALCAEIADVMNALGIEMGPTRVKDGTRIQGLWALTVPFTENGVTQFVEFAVLDERFEVVFATPPRAGMHPTEELLAGNPRFFERVRDASVARLFEVKLQTHWSDG